MKIIQKWDGHRPDYRLLLGALRVLVGERERERERVAASTTASFATTYNRNDNSGGGGGGGGQVHGIAWIQRLLQTPIPDYRQSARD